MELFAKPEIADGAIGKASLFFGGPLCAPVFIGIMGYFLSSSTKPFSYYIKRAFYLFFGGILLNFFFNFHLLYHIIFSKYDYNFFNYFLGVDILPLVGISIFIVGALRHILKDKIIPFILLALLIAGLAPYLPVFGNNNLFILYINAFLWGNFAWSYFPIFPWLAYILIGVALGLFNKKYNLFSLYTKLQWRLFAIPFLIISVASLNYAIAVSHALQGNEGYYHHGILFFFWVISALIGYVIICATFENYFSKNIILRYLKWLGKNVTAIYIFQWLIIGNIATEIYQTQNLKQILCWFVSLLTIASLLTYLWKKIESRIKLKF